MHELLNELIVESNGSENYSVITKDMHSSNDFTLLVNSITASNINPGDIRKSMSTPAKGKSTP